jgi:hypothetical protein
MLFIFVGVKDLWFCVETGKLWEPSYPSPGDRSSACTPVSESGLGFNVGLSGVGAGRMSIT